MPVTLSEIIEHKRAEVAARKEKTPLDAVKEKAMTAPPCRDFESALRRPKGEALKLLAEIKAASPSAGSIREGFDPAEIAKLYEDAGASAVSVLTDEKFFIGSDEHLIAAKAATSLPVLRKDFTIDEYQLYESRALGADAVLLMMQVLSFDEFKALSETAEELGLHVLAEGHEGPQLEYLQVSGAKIVGINNRDFRDMSVDIKATLARRKLIAFNRVLVSQSGIETRADVERLERVHIDAIQVGTSIMKSNDMKEHIDMLLGR